MKNKTTIFQRHQWLLASTILLSGLFQSKLAGAEGCSEPSFAAALTFSAGDAPTSVVVGDLNGDDKSDLVVVNDGSDHASVVLGNGDGTFQSAIKYNVGSGARSVVVADFNGDGRPDLAATSDVGVAVLLGRGDGTFQAAVSYSTGDRPSFVAVGDFNRDGNLDLVVRDAVLLGNGDGTFQPAVNMPGGGESVAVGDFNRDGKLDLAEVGYVHCEEGCAPSRVFVLLGNGDGTFQAPAYYLTGGDGAIFSVAAGDFNRDGILDLVVRGAVLLGNGDGTFQAPAYYPTATADALFFVAVGDFNRDGKPDLAAASGASVAILLGRGDGTFQGAVSYSGGADPQSLAVGDFNGDGKPDLAVANYGSGNVGLLLGQGDGAFQAVANYKSGKSPLSLAVGDFNGDGKPDLAVANAGSFGLADGGVSLLFGKGDGSFQAVASYGWGDGPYYTTVAVSDFNGDSKPDLAVVDLGSYNQNTSTFANRSVLVLLGQGDGTFKAVATNYAEGTHPVFVAVGDFNGDGKPDLAVANSACPGCAPTVDGSISVLLGKGDGTFHVAATISLGRSLTTSVAVGNFNGDGKPDLAVGNVARGFSVLLGNGDGTFQAPVNYDTGADAFFVAVRDFDADGIADLAMASGYSGVSVVLGNGDGTFQGTVHYAAGTFTRSVAVEDFNGDGRTDLATEESVVLLGNGDGTFQAAVSYAVGDTPVSVAVGDFNGDGKPDLAVANANSDNVSVLLNMCVAAGPHLAILRNGTTLTISWPLSSTGFVLESTTSLSLTNWQAAVEMPMTNAGRFEVTVPVNQVQRYFRPHRQ